LDDLEKVAQIREQARSGKFRLSVHAHQEMVEDGFILEDLILALSDGYILEDYPDHRRGACCLLSGLARMNRPMHIVCTTALPVLVIITLYEPVPPKWITPEQRSPGS